MDKSNLSQWAVAAGATVGLLCAVASGDDGVERPGRGLIVVPAPGGLTTFDVSDLGAARSAALRRNTDLADKAGRVPADTPGYELTNAIVVRTDSPAALRAHARLIAPGIPAGAGPGVLDAGAVSVTPIDGVDGFVLVEAPTVRAAAGIANALWSSARYESVEMDVLPPRALRTVEDEPLFEKQWHLRNTDSSIADVNADGAWDLGYTGAGTLIAIVESGFERTHWDLIANYDAAGSMPGGNEHRHATACAGIAAASGVNETGGLGLAFGANIAEHIYGTSAQTGAALGFGASFTDVKSNSWGPPDIRRIEPIPAVELAGIVQAVTTGRGGLGTVMTWAAGNGGENDRVDYDSWASSRYTFAVGAIGFDDAEPIYNELGSSMLVVAHSDGGGRMITTTDLTGSPGYDPGDYTETFGGTSAASPLAAGAISLALEANPLLSWRDVMHLLVNTSRMNDPADSMWETNSAGHDINYRFGYGAVDAGALVTSAVGWTPVAQEVFGSSGVLPVQQSIPDGTTTGVLMNASIPDAIRVETVELTLNVLSSFVGDLRVVLTSPSGTESVMAVPRPDPTDDFTDFTFTSFRHFDESSSGTWSVFIADEEAVDGAYWIDFEIKVYGTQLPCVADLNNDGLLDSGDIALFIGLFGVLDPQADLNGDGLVDNGDIGTFIDAFLAGCPAQSTPTGPQD